MERYVTALLALLVSRFSWPGRQSRALKPAIGGRRTPVALHASTSVPAEIWRDVMRGRRPREWTPSLDACIGAIPRDGSDGGWMTLFSLMKAIDCDDHVRAGQLVDRGLSERVSFSSGPLADFLLQASAFIALVRRDARTARSILEEHPASSYRELSHAAVLLAEGRPDEARAAFRTWTRAVIDRGVTLQLAGNEWLYEELGALLMPEAFQL